MRSKQSILWRNMKIWCKSGKIRKIIRKIISSCHVWKVNYPSCEDIMVKTIEIWRFEKNHKKKRVIFKLLSFAHEVKKGALEDVSYISFPLETIFLAVSLRRENSNMWFQKIKRLTTLIKESNLTFNLFNFDLKTNSYGNV